MLRGCAYRVILTPKAEESSEVLYCDAGNNWILRYAQNDGEAFSVMLRGCAYRVILTPKAEESSKVL